MNSKQIKKMLGIDAGAAEATAETLECLGFNVETAVKAIKCGMEAGNVSRADDGKWLAMDMGLYRWVEEQEARDTGFERLLELAQDKTFGGLLPKGALIEAWRKWDPVNAKLSYTFVAEQTAASETGGATGRDAGVPFLGSGRPIDMPLYYDGSRRDGEEAAVNGGGVG